MRIYTSQSEPLDFCRECAPSEQHALEEFGDCGDGPDGRGNCFGYDEDHPSYEETDYTCEICDKKLTAQDD